jgi:flagellar biosynthetic protein FliO
MFVPKRHSLILSDASRTSSVPKLRLAWATALVALLLASGSCWSASSALSQSSRERVGVRGPATTTNASGVTGYAKTAPPNADFIASLEAGEKQNAPDKEPPLAMTLARFIVSLVLVLGLAYATILGLKRFTGLKSAGGSSGRRIKIVENSQLGPNRALHLVEIGGRRLLVASTPNQVSLIAEIEAEAPREGEAPAEPIAGFKDQLALFLGNKSDSETVSRSVGQMLRDSSTLLQDGINRIGSLRRRLRDA